MDPNRDAHNFGSLATKLLSWYNKTMKTSTLVLSLATLYLLAAYGQAQQTRGVAESLRRLDDPTAPDERDCEIGKLSLL